MNKKNIIIIISILILIIIGGICIKMKEGKKEKSSNINTNTINIDEKEIEDKKFSIIENQFKENGINLKNKKEINSSEIEESGFEYEVGSSKIEMYSVSDDKLKYLTNSEEIPQGIILISTKNTIKKEVINFHNMIVSCTDKKLKQKIIDILNHD